MPPNFCTSSVLSAMMASMTSSTVTMPRTCPSSATTGTASRLYFESSLATSSRSVSGETVIGSYGRAAERTGVLGSLMTSRHRAMTLTKRFVSGSRMQTV